MTQVTERDGNELITGTEPNLSALISKTIAFLAMWGEKKLSNIRSCIAKETLKSSKYENVSTGAGDEIQGNDAMLVQ